MKYIICYPSDGINDILCTINRCFLYAIKHDRTLIIDTTKMGWFKHNIHDYIRFNHDKIYVGNTHMILEQLKDLPIYPGMMKNRLIRPSWNAFGKFNINRIYSEDVVVSLTLGGGLCTEILQYITFKPNILNIYKNRLQQLPKDFIGIHIRNTDKKSNIPAFIKEHKNIFIQENCDTPQPTALFIASDDRILLDNLYNNYKNVYRFSDIPILRKNEINIHHYNHTVEHTTFIIDCFVDLLLLASGKGYIYSCKYGQNKRGSGFSRLAEILFKDKKTLQHITAFALTATSSIRPVNNKPKISSDTQTTNFANPPRFGGKGGWCRI